ncbi:ATP12 family chaperone protein [Curvivirga sp.]|uniref:ATP12 family chaperone protein n=1 Tax=Curvivirga sp. TaxID=2856848 RepID=UPI003B58F913
MKRFYKNAGIAESGDNFVVQLDGRSIKTKSKVTLEVPSAALAEIIAEEWNAQGEEVDPTSMPIMTLANTTVDRVVPSHTEIADMLAEYGGNDLLCYRAEPTQEELVRKQQDQWNPWIDWAMRELDAPLKVTTGIMHVEQDEKAVSALAKLVHATTAFELTALHEFTTMSGSLVLGLAVLREELAAAEALKLGLLDELHQAELWGEDFEAQDRREKYHREMTQAEIFLKALRA